jgi:hypothetical protein
MLPEQRRCKNVSDCLILVDSRKLSPKLYISESHIQFRSDMPNKRVGEKNAKQKY